MLCKVDHNDYNWQWSNSFMEWFTEKHPCAHGSPTYKEAVKKCLLTSANISEDLILYSNKNDLPIAILNSKKTSLPLPKSLWEKVFLDNLGVCYTLNTGLWTR